MRWVFGDAGTRRRAKLPGVALALALVATGAAEVRQSQGSDLRIVSSFAAYGAPLPGDCLRQAAVFAKAAAELPPSRQWHWVLVCDEAGWERFLRLSGRGGGTGIYASTDLSSRTTYVRGEALLQSGGFRTGTRDVIAHELAHAAANDEDEVKAERLGRQFAKRPLPHPSTAVPPAGNVPTADGD